MNVIIGFHIVYVFFLLSQFTSAFHNVPLKIPSYYGTSKLSTQNKLYVEKNVEHIYSKLYRASLITSLPTIRENFVYTAFTYILQSAANRSRLDGTTFKLLNFGIAVFSVVTILVDFINVFFMTIQPIYPLEILVKSSLFISKLISIYVSVSVIRQFKLPQFKITINNYLSALYQVT